jgi:hypothetical protein
MNSHIHGWDQFPKEMVAKDKADLVMEKPYELEHFERSISQLLPP